MPMPASSMIFTPNIRMRSEISRTTSRSLRHG
jgi:hypothetical protein